MSSGQFYEKRLSVRERNMKLLPETVTYLAIKERVTCIITIETLMCIMHYRKYHLHNCSRDFHLHNYNKIVTHIVAAETVTVTVICIIGTERSTNISVIESTTSKPA